MLLKKSKDILRNIKSGGNVGIKSDAIRAAWRLVRHLEKLALPLSVYNRESKSFWNSYSLGEIKDAVEKYIPLVSNSDQRMASQLDACLKTLAQVYSNFETKEPPYWSALSNYFMDRPPDGALRVIIFPSRNQKRLFSYSILSTYNLLEKELLDDSRILLRTIKEFASPDNDDAELFKQFKVEPIFIGLPDHYNSSLFYQILNRFNVNVLIYPHQTGVLHTIVNSYNQKEKIQTENSVLALASIAEKRDKATLPALKDRYGVCKTFQKLTINLGATTKVDESKYEGTIEIGDIHTELARLLETSQEDDDVGYLVSITLNKAKENESKEANSYIVENAIEIMLEGGYSLFIDPNEQVNIIKNKEVVKIFARAIATGNLILCIQNQVRKDLFDLLIERIHNHRALSFHLHLLQKWREEFYMSYMRWKDSNAGNNLDEFWKLLKTNGADIVSSLTVSNWLHGYTLRPQDTTNILRVGNALNNKFIVDHHNEIANAASRIVGLHIQLSKKLKKWLEGGAYNLEKDDMVMVDEELGLTLGELRSSMKILRVLEIKTVNIPTLRNTIGILQKK